MSEHKVNSLLLAHYNYVVNVKVIDLSKAGIKFVYTNHLLPES